MKKLFLILLLFFSCKKNTSKEVEIIRVAIKHNFWESEKAFGYIRKEVAKPGGEKYRDIYSWASTILKIRNKAFLERNDSVFYISKPLVIQYSKDLKSFVQKNQHFTQLKKVQLDIEGLEKDGDELDFMLRILEIAYFESEIMTYLSSMIGNCCLSCFDDYYHIFHSNDIPKLRKPYYFTMQRVDSEGLRLNDIYQLKNIKWTINDRVLKQTFNLEKLGNSYLIFFTPLQKGRYEFSATVSYSLELNTEKITKTNEVKHIINVE